MSEELNGVRCWEERMMGILCCQKKKKIETSQIFETR